MSAIDWILENAPKEVSDEIIASLEHGYKNGTEPMEKIHHVLMGAVAFDPGEVVDADAIVKEIQSLVDAPSSRAVVFFRAARRRADDLRGEKLLADPDSNGRYTKDDLVEVSVLAGRAFQWELEGDREAAEGNVLDVVATLLNWHTDRDAQGARSV